MERGKLLEHHHPPNAARKQKRKHNWLGFCSHLPGTLQQQGGHMCYNPPAGDAPLFSFKKINRQLHMLVESALALQVKGYHLVQANERKPNLITCRFNNPLINKVRSKIKIVAPNYNWNFMWQKRHVHIIAINLRKPPPTHTTVCLGGCSCGTDRKISAAQSPTYASVHGYTAHDAQDMQNRHVFSLTLTVYMGK